MSKSKTVSLSEFKAWISGIEEMQEKNWYPSPQQWKLIRNKIDLIACDEIQIPQKGQVYTNFNNGSIQPIQNEQVLKTNLPQQSNINRQPLNLPPQGINGGPVDLASKWEKGVSAIQTPDASYVTSFE